jgi:hypothetical protein
VQLSPAGLAAGADDAVVQYSPVTFMLRIAACNMSDDEQEQLLFPSTFFRLISSRFNPSPRAKSAEKTAGVDFIALLKLTSL